MPVVPCLYCSNPVTLPDPWKGTAYTCPHCRRVVATAPPPAPPPPPVPPPLSLPDEDFEPDPEPRSRPRRRPSGNPIFDFLTFRLMITPILLQIVFWLGVVAFVRHGGQKMAASFDAPPDITRSSLDVRDFDRSADEKTDKQKTKVAPAKHFSPTLFAEGLAILLVGPLVLRILCELDIILFKIHDELKSSNDRHRYRS